MRDVLVPALAAASPGGPLNDAAVVEVAGSRLAFTTDSFVVSPIRFPGGDIGELAVNGTINDLAMMGAAPIAISLRLRDRGGAAARGAARDHCLGGLPPDRAVGARIVTGRHQGRGPRCRGSPVREHVGHRNGAGRRRSLRGARAAGDAVLVSGPIGPPRRRDHERARGLEFEVEIASDTQALNGLVVPRSWRAEPDVHVLRDPTRGGLSSALNEVAATSRVGMVLDEPAIPIPGPSVPRASSWVSIRFTSPTRASWSRSCPPSRRTPCWPRCAPRPRAPARPGSARSSPTIRAWSRCARS